LEKGEYFIADLIGLPVIDADNGKEYGHVKELINRGASDLYVVKTKTDEAMIPDVPQFIDHVDVKKGVFIRPIEGMFPAEDV
jgi:16S rRNA processing protein RimM